MKYIGRSSKLFPNSSKTIYYCKNDNKYNKPLQSKMFKQSYISMFPQLHLFSIFGPASARSDKIGVVGNNWLVGWLASW